MNTRLFLNDPLNDSMSRLHAAVSINKRFRLCNFCQSLAWFTTIIVLDMLLYKREDNYDRYYSSCSLDEDLMDIIQKYSFTIQEG